MLKKIWDNLEEFIIVPLIFAMSIIIFIQVIMRVGCALFLTKAIGYTGIFWGELCAWIGADIFLICILNKKIQ